MGCYEFRADKVLSYLAVRVGHRCCWLSICQAGQWIGSTPSPAGLHLGLSCWGNLRFRLAAPNLCDDGRHLLPLFQPPNPCNDKSDPTYNHNEYEDCI